MPKPDVSKTTVRERANNFTLSSFSVVVISQKDH